MELRRKQSDEVHKNGGICVPYSEYNTMSDDGQQAYFGEAWKASSGPLWYAKSLTDYVIWNLDQWVKSCKIDGWYLDNVRPVHCDDIDAEVPPDKPAVELRVEKGRLVVPVERHDCRLITIGR